MFLSRALKRQQVVSAGRTSETGTSKVNLVRGIRNIAYIKNIVEINVTRLEHQMA